MQYRAEHFVRAGGEAVTADEQLSRERQLPRHRSKTTKDDCRCTRRDHRAGQQSGYTAVEFGAATFPTTLEVVMPADVATKDGSRNKMWVSGCAHQRRRKPHAIRPTKVGTSEAEGLLAQNARHPLSVESEGVSAVYRSYSPRRSNSQSVAASMSSAGTLRV